MEKKPVPRHRITGSRHGVVRAILYLTLGGFEVQPSWRTIAESDYPPFPLPVRVILRILLRAAWLVVWCVFAVPWVWRMLTGRVISAEMPLPVWGVVGVCGSAAAELTQWLLTRHRPANTAS